MANLPVGFSLYDFIKNEQFSEIQIVHWINQGGGQPEYQDPSNGMTALMQAAFHSWPKAVDALLKTGKAHPEYKNDQGWNALMWAIYYGGSVNSVKVVQFLLNYDPKLANTFDDKGDTPLMLAKFDIIAKLLLETGESHPEYKNNKGKTALMFASEFSHINIVKLLLDFDSHPEYQDNKGKTALMLASYAGHVNIVKLLLQHPDSHPEYENVKRKTALDLAKTQTIRKLISDSIKEIEDQYRPGRYIERQSYYELFGKSSECTEKSTRDEILEFVKNKITNMSRDKISYFIRIHGPTHDIKRLCKSNILLSEASLKKCKMNELVKTGKLIAVRMSHGELCEVLDISLSDAKRESEKCILL